MLSYHTIFLLLLSGHVAAGQNTGGVSLNSQPCKVDSDCPLIQCLIAPCPANVCTDGTCGIEENPPNPECVQDSDCPPITCFTAPCEQHVCNEGLCGPASNDGRDDQIGAGIPCGPSLCTNGDPCCNESCGYCGQMCSEEYCEPAVDEGFLGDMPTNNDTSVCRMDSDCPVIQCLVPPCDIHVCNVTSGECIQVEYSDDAMLNDTWVDPCTANSTCGDSIDADNQNDLELNSRARDNGADPSAAKSGMARQLVVLLPLAIVGASCLL